LSLIGTEASLKYGIDASYLMDLNQRMHADIQASVPIAYYTDLNIPQKRGVGTFCIPLVGTEGGRSAYDSYFEPTVQVIPNVTEEFLGHTKAEIVEEIRNLDNAYVGERIMTPKVGTVAGTKLIGIYRERQNDEESIMLEVERERRSFVYRMFGDLMGNRIKHGDSAG
jgi:hypothetical protein